MMSRPPTTRPSPHGAGESSAVPLKIRAIKKAASPALAGKATWGLDGGGFMPLLLVPLPPARAWLRAAGAAG
jgi:hypothetical protein